MNVYTSSQRSRDRIISALSAGVFLILIGALFIVTPTLFDSLIDFLENFDVFQVPNLSGIFLPAPKDPAVHVTVYSAVALFSLAWGIFLIGVLVVRVFANSPLHKKAENASDIVFWLLASYLINWFLNDSTTIALWFEFWAAIITLIGTSLIIRAAILAVSR
jgi:hypothetical protein